MSSAFSQGFATFMQCFKEEAASHFTRHLEAFPNDFACLHYRGISYSILGKSDKAIQDFVRAEQVGNPCEKLVAQGLRLKEQGRVDESTKVLKHATAAYPRKGIAWHHYACDLMKAGLTKDAAAAFRNAISLGYQFSCVSQCLLGKILAAEGRHDEAISQYEASLKDNSSTTICHIGLGDSLLATGRSSRAEDCYKKAVELNPTQMQANLGLASIYLQEGDYVGASKEFEVCQKEKFMGADDLIKAMVDLSIQKPDPSKPGTRQKFDATDSKAALDEARDLMNKGNVQAALSVIGKWTAAGRSKVGDLMMMARTPSAGGGGGSSGGGSSGGSGGGNGDDGKGSGSNNDDKWKLTARESLQIGTHHLYGKFYQWQKNPRLWFVKDRAHHAGAAYKVYEDKGDRLEFYASADEQGQFIEKKHESRVGHVIKKKELAMKSFDDKKT
eukprot:m.309394 g.309394  ORF g.309394 m.309394 type:complete len:443 (+) comp46320_c0_seq1:44-1372(+)